MNHQKIYGRCRSRTYDSRYVCSRGMPSGRRQRFGHFLAASSFRLCCERFTTKLTDRSCSQRAELLYVGDYE